MKAGFSSGLQSHLNFLPGISTCISHRYLWKRAPCFQPPFSNLLCPLFPIQGITPLYVRHCPKQKSQNHLWCFQHPQPSTTNLTASHIKSISKINRRSIHFPPTLLLQHWCYLAHKERGGVCINIPQCPVPYSKELSSPKCQQCCFWKTFAPLQRNTFPTPLWELQTLFYSSMFSTNATSSKRPLIILFKLALPTQTSLPIFLMTKAFSFIELITIPCVLSMCHFICLFCLSNLIKYLGLAETMSVLLTTKSAAA